MNGLLITGCQETLYDGLLSHFSGSLEWMNLTLFVSSEEENLQVAHIFKDKLQRYFEAGLWMKLWRTTEGCYHSAVKLVSIHNFKLYSVNSLMNEVWCKCTQCCCRLESSWQEFGSYFTVLVFLVPVLQCHCPADVMRNRSPTVGPS